MQACPYILHVCHVILPLSSPFLLLLLREACADSSHLFCSPKCYASSLSERSGGERAVGGAAAARAVHPGHWGFDRGCIVSKKQPLIKNGNWLRFFVLGRTWLRSTH